MREAPLRGEERERRSPTDRSGIGEERSGKFDGGGEGKNFRSGKA